MNNNNSPAHVLRGGRVINRAVTNCKRKYTKRTTPEQQHEQPEVHILPDLVQEQDNSANASQLSSTTNRSWSKLSNLSWKSTASQSIPLNDWSEMTNELNATTNEGN